jgi:hypothetical protein
MGDLASKYKMSVRRYMKILEQNSVKVKVVSEYGDQADRLLELWQQCYDHSREYQREVLTRDYFINMSRYMKGKTKLLEFLKDGKLIGYSLAIKDIETFHGLFAGMDYDYVRDNYLLFNLYGHTVKLGIEEGAQRIEMGLTTTYEKLSFGSVVVPMFAYMRHLSPVLNPILTNLFVLFSESTRFHAKHVFNRRFCGRVYADGHVSIEYKDRAITAGLLDVSLTGVRVKAEELLKKGRVLMKFIFHNSLNNFQVPAKLVWSENSKNEMKMGFVFKTKDPSIKEKIRQLNLSFDIEGSNSDPE